MKNSKNDLKKARQIVLKNELTRDSQLIRDNSMEVLTEFEQLPDEILEN